MKKVSVMKNKKELQSESHKSVKKGNIKKIQKVKSSQNTFLSESIGKYAIIIVAVFAFILHFQTVFFGYTNCDDDLIISKNDYLSDFSNFTNAFSEPYFGGSYYRPMVIASFVVDANIAGEEAWVYHLFNVIYHVISCIGIVILFRKLKYSHYIAMIAGLMYASHPIFSNSISWILGRNDLLVGMFGIYSFVFLLDYIEKKKIVYVIIHALFLLLSCLSKEAGLILPVIGFAYLWLIRKEKLVNLNNIVLAVSWILIWIIWYAMKSNAVIASPEAGDFAYSNLLKNIRQIPEIFARFILPYDTYVLPTYHLPQLIIGLVFIAAISFNLIKNKTIRKNYALYGLIWFLLFVFPGLFISIKDKPDYFDYLDTRMYLPMIGMLILIFEMIPLKYKQFNEKSYLAVYGGIILILAVLNFFHSQNYDNRYVFWSCAVEDDPNRARFYNQLGLYYFNEGKYDKAEENYLRAIELNPLEVSYYSKLGLNYMKQNKKDLAMKIYKKGREANRFNAELNINLGAAYNESRQYDSAVVVLRDALHDKKTLTSALTNIINSFSSMELYDSAFKYAGMQAQMGNSGGLADVNMQWGINLYQKGDYTSALEKMQKANEILPNSYNILNSLAAAQMLNNKFREAEENLLKANKINPNGMEVYSNLLRLYAYHLKDKQKYDYYVNILKKMGDQVPQEVRAMMNVF